MPSEALQNLVRARAWNRCEYCQMSQELQGAKYHIDHIVPKSKGGTTVEGNLALACPSCNFYKANQTTFEDPEGRQTAQLFNPRKQVWTDHFRFEWNEVVGLTNVGRATIELLRLNSERRLQIREIERLIGIFPP